MRAWCGRAALVAFTASVAISASAQDAPSPRERTRAEAFARRLVQAMARGDRAAVAGMLRYPATAIAGGLNIPILDRSTALELYTLVFTPELRCLLETAPRPQIDGGGVTFASGRLRAEASGDSLEITRVVVPPASGQAPPPPSKPTPVIFRWGSGQAQYSGRLYGDGVDSYVVRAARGARLEARIERFPGRSAAVRVVQQASGRALDRPGATAPRLWTGTISETGEYRVDVVRLAPYCQPSFTYLLTLTLR